jgi:hypothetical protein
MKSKTKRGVHRFPLSLLHYGNSYYIDRIAELETALAKKPRQLQIDMLGEGEIPADWALLIRSVLGQRSSKTWIITNARSSLQNGSVLVWLQGDRRIIRDDARLFFRRADVSDDKDEEKVWKEGDLKHAGSRLGGMWCESTTFRSLQTATIPACSSKRTGGFIPRIALDQCRVREHYPARRPFYIPEREAAQAIPFAGHEPVEETGRGCLLV